MSSLMPKAINEIAEFAARWSFDQAASAASQQDLARRIEAALADFKATEMQAIINRTLRDALTRCIAEAIESWSRSYYPPQPYVSEPEPAPEPRRRRAKKAPNPEMDAAA